MPIEQYWGYCDDPDLDCLVGHHAYIDDDEECFSFPVYDFFLEWQNCEDPNACGTVAELWLPWCCDVEEEIPF